MKNRFGSILPAALGVALTIVVGCIPYAIAASATQAPDQQKGTTVSNHARGTFDVKVIPQGEPDKADGNMLSRVSLDKQFHGELEGSSKGEMLGANTAVKNSAAYVALERVSGTLNGRKGTFILQHSGTMTRGALQQIITVVPDSGTGQLEGISGSMKIDVVQGKHSYDFEYTRPAIP